MRRMSSTEVSKGKGGAERRRWPRAQSELPIVLSIDGRDHPAKLRDLSRAGVCFYLERSLPLMTVLGVALDLTVGGKTHKLRAKGAVVRCERSVRRCSTTKSRCSCTT
jgi:hypothetical protein